MQANKRKSQPRAPRLQYKTAGVIEKHERRLSRDFRLVAAALRVWETKQIINETKTQKM
jgi:hypothetical protein